MKLFFKSKDGGPESKVTGYWLVESKSLGSIVLLRFDRGSREAFHTHAFHAVSWVLKGGLLEVFKGRAKTPRYHSPSWRPLVTKRSDFHKVYGVAEHTWVLSFRGPWSSTWLENVPGRGDVRMAHGRVEVG